MTAPFKDHFSGHSDSYAAYRPVYPKTLFDYLAGLCGAHELAWDCATGNGQAANSLAQLFDKVIATDASEQQISNARQCDGVEYRVAPAEATNIDDASVDLVTVAQALHWFDASAFFAEADRVLKPGGVLAVWCYQNCVMDAEINKIIIRCFELVDDFWAPERVIVDSGYADIAFPFHKLDAENFNMRANWTADEMLGYMRTWSASQNYIRQTGSDPMDRYAEELLSHWGPDRLEVRWPLILQIRRK